jgi:hypothetical protein
MRTTNSGIQLFNAREIGSRAATVDHTEIYSSFEYSIVLFREGQVSINWLICNGKKILMDMKELLKIVFAIEPVEDTWRPRNTKSLSYLDKHYKADSGSCWEDYVNHILSWLEVNEDDSDDDRREIERFLYGDRNTAFVPSLGADPLEYDIVGDVVERYSLDFSEVWNMPFTEGAWADYQIEME